MASAAPARTSVSASARRVLRDPPPTRWVIGALTLAGFLARAWALGAKELRGDESFAAVFAAQPLAVIWQELGRSEPHPPLYYFLLHGAILATGPSNYALRYPSALLGALAVPALAVAAWQLFGRWPALLTAALTACNPLLVWQAQDARMYAPLVGFLGVALAAGATTLAGARGRAPILTLTIAAAGALLTHFFAVFVVVGIAAGLAAGAIRRLAADDARRSGEDAIRPSGGAGRSSEPADRAPRFAARPALVGATLLIVEGIVISGPLLWHGRAALASHPPFAALGPLALVRSAGLAVAGAFTTPIPLRAPTGDLAILLALGGLALAWRRRPRGGLVVGGALLAPLLALEALEWLHPAYQPAYAAVVAPAWLLCFGALAGTRGRWAAPLVVVAIGGLGLIAEQALTTYAASQKNLTFDQAARLLGRAGRPGDVVLVNYPDPTLQWVYQRQDHGPLPVQLVPAASPVAATALDQTMIKLANQYDRVWFWTLRTTDWDPQHLTETWLDRHALPLATERAGNVEFRLFETPRGFARGSVPLPAATFDGQVRLCGASWPTAPVAAGATLNVELCWQTVATPRQEFTAFVHLERGAALGGQDDHPPVNGLNPMVGWQPGEAFLDRFAVRVAATAAPGVYAVRVGLYTPSSLQRLPVRSPSGVALGDALTVGEVTVR